MTATEPARDEGLGSGRAGDILADQPADERLLAEIYDLEHDEIVDDIPFHREWSRRHPGDVLDLGCGSGRLFAAFLGGGARRVIGVDASRALLERAQQRIARHPRLREARDAGRIELLRADVREVALRQSFSLVVLAGVISHLDGAAEARRALRAAGAHLGAGGALIVDTIGPGGIPDRDLPLSVDWERSLGGRRVVRRSRIARTPAAEPAADAVSVLYETLTELEDPDGTIARLPAIFRLWYPSPSALFTLATEAELEVEATYGSYDLDPLDEASDRCIAVMRRATATPGRG